MDAFIQIAIIGAALSALVEFVQAKTGAKSLETKMLAIILSIIVGTLYWFFSQTAYYQSVLGVLAAASTVYAVFFNNSPKGVMFEEKFDDE